MSERGFSATIETVLSQNTADIALLVYLDFPGGAVRMWSGYGSITYDSNTWLGAAELGNLDKIAESVSHDDIGIELTLNFLDDSIRDEVVANDPVGQDASIYFAVMDRGPPPTVDDAYEIFPGFIDEVEILDDANSGAILVRVASEWAKLKRPRAFQMSDAHQQYLFAGDLGNQFADQMDEPIVWGRSVVVPGPGRAPKSPGPGRPRRDKRPTTY